MVDKQIVIDTIKKMMSAGLDDKVIVSTLKDVGLKESEIAAFLAEARGKPVTPFGSSPVLGNKLEQEPETISQSRSQSIPASSQQHQENVLLHTTTHAALETSSSQLQEITQKLLSLEQKMGAVASLPVADLNLRIVNFDKRVASITTEIADLKSQTSALREILEKVLDTNRSILQELESKK